MSELATQPKLRPRDFIRCSGHDGRLQLTFSVLKLRPGDGPTASQR